MSPQKPASSPTRPLAWQARVRGALLPALLAGVSLAAWRAGADPAPPHPVPAFEAAAVELRACQHRVAVGYVTSGISVTADDALAIYAACERLTRERGQRRESGEIRPHSGG